LIESGWDHILDRAVAANGEGNTNPRRAYMRQPAVRLSNEGYEWLNTKLEEAFQTNGKLPPAELAHLDWPELPVPSAQRIAS
jgi:hypothetical protein